MSCLRNIRAWGLTLFALFLLSAIATANASAAQWTLNGAAITSAVPTSGTGTLKLTDEAGGPFSEPVTVECSGSTTGTAGPGAKDTTSTVTVSSCRTIEGICESPSASAVDLPWSTELVELGGVVRDKIMADGKGEPGYKVECTFFGVRTSDICTSKEKEPGRMGMPDVTALNTSPVPLEFDAGSGTANCTLGGTGKGHVRGAVKVMSSKGTLTVS
ncbi:MAG: hypothetical protein ACTHNP_00965 [Solirubrobacterales bacterium]